VSLRERLLARQLPSEVVTLPAVGGGEPERIELRAIPADVWEALVAAHPPTGEQAEQGADWNVATFRPALLALTVVTPEGEEPLTEADWAQLASSGAMSIGELTLLFNVAVALNDRSPLASVGKG
jgi:hypothetical protein